MSRFARFRWLPIATLLFAALAACSVSMAAAPKPLRIVTFNAEILNAPRVRAGQLEKFRFDHARREHHERVANTIEVLHPDIVNLVEATSSEAVDSTGRDPSRERPGRLPRLPRGVTRLFYRNGCLVN